MKHSFAGVKKLLGRYFNLLPDKEDEHAVIEQVKVGTQFRGTNLWILIFAILIASLGLNVNSTAVIIGAMLISPLMGPIIGMGLSVGISDFEMLKQSLKNYGVATLISVATATLYFWISPLSEAQSELLARTSPTLYDVLIAFCGGAAGVLALTTKSKGQVIPGVAIATALMPPLCTAGYGLATGQWTYFFGAFYLFFINTVFIATATFLGVKFLRFHPVATVEGDAARRGRRIIYSVVLITLIPAAIMTVRIIQRNIFETDVNHFVKAELDQEGTRILRQSVEEGDLTVVAVGETISDEKIATAQSHMHFYNLMGYGLNVIQANGGADVALLGALEGSRNTNTALSVQVVDLQGKLDFYTRYDTLSRQVSEEAQALFGEVSDVALGYIGGRTTALVRVNKPLPTPVKQRLEQWLAKRTGDDEIDVVMRRE